MSGVTIRIALHRPADGTGDIIACCPPSPMSPAASGMFVGSVVRQEPGPGVSRGWRARLWRSHPSALPEGEPFAERYRDLAKYLTGQVAEHGEWWE